MALFGKGRRNTGRKELRGTADSAQSKEKTTKRSRNREAENETGDIKNASSVEADLERDERLDAYKVLLTLLKDNEDEPAPKKRKKEEAREVHAEDGDEDESDDDDDERSAPREGNEEDEGEVGDIEGEEEIEGANSEDENNEEDQGIQLDDNIEENQDDPFNWHFANPKSQALESPANVEWKNVKTDVLGKQSVATIVDSQKQKQDEEEENSPLGKLIEEPVQSTKSLRLKYRLSAPFSRENGVLTQLQRQIAGPIFKYQDVMYAGRTTANEAELRRLCVLHVVNHIFKTRDVILRHNAQIEGKKKNLVRDVGILEEDEVDEEEGREEQDSLDEQRDEEEDFDKFRDQGFTRPKVVILVPTRNAAYEFVEMISKISGLKQMENKKRFRKAFYNESVLSETKPEDFRRLFQGNSNDLFCLGVRFTPQSMRLYSSFYMSDLIIASPLGLRMIVGSPEKRKQDYDFLSSIEIALVDQLDAMQMQAWDNVSTVFKHMNLIPKEQHDCDFSRVRMTYIDEKAKYLRQTILLSQYRTPEMNGLWHKQCLNIGGKIRAKVEYSGVLGHIGLRIRQTFNRLPNSSGDPTRDPDMRFKYFTQTVLPSILRGAEPEGTLIFVPSYIDYVRIRNYMDNTNMPCTCICEYSSNSEITRARAFFASKRTKMLVYTERLHHFRRYELKGVRQIVMYGVPENPEFYKEIARYLVNSKRGGEVDPSMMWIKVLYSKWDSLKLERVVGTKRVGALLGENEAYEFY